VLPEVQHDAAESASSNEMSIRGVLEGLLQKQAAAVAGQQLPRVVGQEVGPVDKRFQLCACYARLLTPALHLQNMSPHASRSATLGQQQLHQEQQQADAVAQAQQPSVPFPGHQPDSAQVRMESQLIFDSCWRRLKEKHGMVSNTRGEQLRKAPAVPCQQSRYVLDQLLSMAC
jgi:hypothetical protein